MKNQMIYAMMIELHVAIAVIVGGCLPSPGVACGNGWCSEGDRCANPSSATPVCVRSTCGNGIRDPGEECDDGNSIDGDRCSANCMLEPFCGNGILDPGEECDDGNRKDDDGCSASCTVQRCGNGNLDPHEECDDGNQINGDGCEGDCTLPVCGNRITDPGEECDDGDPELARKGMAKVDSMNCDFDCTLPVCGDGHINTRVGEVCDDGANNGKLGSTCSLTCQNISCGNGVIEQGEECDDGSENNQIGKRCNAKCKLNFCGDGDTLAGVEQCDKGTSDSLTCDADCTFAVCGDGHWNRAAHEDCDDGAANGTVDSMCDLLCRLKGCGNGIVEPGEQCDPGAPGRDSLTCNSDCTISVCGDGHENREAHEVCDDGPNNGNPCDYNDQTCLRCNSTCTAKVSPGGPFCGDAQVNGTTQHPEVCDQGPLNGTQCAYGDTTCLSNPNALCNADCSGFAGALHGPYCGDGMAQPPFEECDPGGNTLTPANNSACDSDCTFPVCGDGHVNSAAGETCDDRNSSACGTCSADCKRLTLSPAAGEIGTVAATESNIENGDTFTLNDGFQRNTFQFAINGSTGGVPGDNIVIVISSNDTSETVASAIMTAINERRTVAIDATLGASSATVELRNRRATSRGNQPITATGRIATRFHFAGMLGGQGGDCATGIGCKTGDDCTSGMCTGGRCE